MINVNVYVDASAFSSIRNGASIMTQFLSGQTDQLKFFIETKLKFFTIEWQQQKQMATENSRSHHSLIKMAIYIHLQV